MERALMWVAAGKRCRISFQDSRPQEYDAATSDSASYIAAINAMKPARGVAILAHNYQAPEIFHGVADITGDSLALAQAAAESTPTSLFSAAFISWPRRPRC